VLVGYLEFWIMDVVCKASDSELNVVHTLKYDSFPIHFIAIISSTYISLKMNLTSDRLCGLVVSVSGCYPRGPEFDSPRYQIF
jgi:hypothetical protein